MTPTPPLPPHLHKILYSTKNKYINSYLAFYIILGRYGFERAILELFGERWHNRYSNWFMLQIGSREVSCGYCVRELDGVRRLTVSISGGKTKTLLKHPNLPQLTHLHPYILQHFKTIIPDLEKQFKKYNQNTFKN